MTRFQQFVVWAVIAALVLGMGLPLIAMGQQPRQPADDDASADPRMVFSHYSKAIADKDFRAATNYLSPMACRLMLILVATRMANTQPLAAGAERILTTHKAQALRDVPGTLDEVASVVENWSEKFGAIESPSALLAELAAFGDEKGMPVLNALPEGAVLRPNVAAERGQFAWAHHFVDFRGQQQQLRTICIKVDGQWKLLSFNHIFYLVAMQIYGYQISSPPAYDVVAYKRTRDTMHALEGPILAAVTDGRLPGAAEAPSTIGLLRAIGRHNAPTDAVAQTNAGAELVDGWGRPLRYAVQGDTATLRSPGYDGQFDTDDDIVNAVKIGDTPGPDALPRVRLKTTKGDIVIELFEDDAPNAVANFLHLVEQGFYSGTKFHRIIEGFMAQGGDPNTRTGEGLPGTGGAGYSLPDEYTPTRTFDSAGVFAYANSGSDTSSSQFFITLGATPHLNDTVDPRSGRLIHYTIFGRVVEGMDVVQAIGKTPVAAAASGEPSRPLQDVTIRSAEVISKRNHSYPIRKLSE